MELRFYDENLNFLGIVENQISFVWTRKFFEVGEFSVVLPVTEDNLNFCKIGNIVSYKNAKDGGVIEDIITTINKDEKKINISGRFLASYMDRRLIRPTFNFSGKVEVAMRRILANAVPIPLVELGNLNNFDERIIFQASYRNLLKIMEKLSKVSNIGYKFRPDFTAKKIFFETYKGVDHSRSQSDRVFVEFSDKFNNLNSIEHRENVQNLKNVGYVGGEGEGSARTYVVIGDDALSGLERREVYIDARDIQSENLSSEEYKETLITRGNEKMLAYAKINSYDTSTIPQGNFEYKIDYDLGDVVTIQNEDLGFRENKKITEISEVYENGGVTIVPTFGTPLPTAINWEED